MGKEKAILAVGSIAIDTLKTPKGNRDDLLGGSASYFSIAASLFAPVKMVGVVGDDYPEKGREMFLSRGISLENVQVVDGKTFRWGGKYSDDYSCRDTLFTDIGVFNSFSPKIIEPDCHCPLVFLGNIQPDLQIKVANMVVSPEYIISDTMNLWINLFPQKLKEMIKKSDVFLINQNEAELFSGISDVKAVAQIFLDMGPVAVVIKMGSRGAYLAQKNSGVFVPAYPVAKLIDPTGAGDSFAGGFMGYLSRTVNPDFSEAVITGSAVASFCVEGFGLEALLSMTSRGLKDRIKVIKKLISKGVIL